MHGERFRALPSGPKRCAAHLRTPLRRYLVEVIASIPSQAFDVIDQVASEYPTPTAGSIGEATDAINAYARWR